MARRPGGVPLLAGSGVLGVFGLGIVAHGMSQLGWAHRYRVRTGEGTGFVQVGFELLAGGLLALIAMGGFAWVASQAKRDDPKRRVAIVAAVALTLVLVGCAITAIAVEARGRAA